MYRVQLFLGLDVVEHVGVANVLEDLGLPAVELAPSAPVSLPSLPKTVDISMMTILSARFAASVRSITSTGWRRMMER
jgi:hypothetical protein